MDPLTHGLASLALQRGFFPRTSWRAVLVILAAGTIADLDWFTAALGPSPYLHWHRTASHSLAFVVLLAAIAFLFTRSSLAPQTATRWSGLTSVAVAAAAALHLLIDLLQDVPVMPFWPFSQKRYALDLAPPVDPWLIVIFAAAILFPELILLVSDEIGSRRKQPRGRNGAVFAFIFVILYLGVRALFHANAVAALDSRTIAGEMPRRVAAFPDAVSPFLWHGIVETESAVHLFDLRTMGGEVAYASGVTTLRKPEPSPVLSAAQTTPSAIAFLKFARFPKATQEVETAGYSVEIRDLKDQATEQKSRAIFAEITLDPSARVLSSTLQWQQLPASK